MPVCPSCGQENPDRFRFCGTCGAPLDARLAREERKVVSVFFCDLVGSTAQADALDPEDVRALLSRYHRRVRAELVRHGGTVEKFIGDAVVALFGAPLARDDDPLRAVHAALAVRDWVGDEPNLHLRIAVNTGEVLVALDVDPAEGEGMAYGEVVNTAARLQSAAPVDGILVGDATYRSTERAIEYRAAEPVTAKGKSEPVPVWEVVCARSHFDPGRFAVPFVGRERELELLLDAFRRACEERTTGLIRIAGPPGIGKSRLVAEFLAAIDGGGARRLQGRSLPFGQGVSFWALGEMLKAEAEILETDDADAASRKLADTTARLLSEPGEARWVESHLRPLAGLTLDGAAADRRDEAFSAWRRFLEALADERPLVLAFEDVHWADEGLLDFVDQIVRIRGVPLLVIATARPELAARRSDWADALPLAPLADEETARLVEALLERAALPAENQEALLERASGNPLYAEELVRMVAERGGSERELPESVQAIIAARIDALAPETKELLQSAAVIGKVFWSGALGGHGVDVEQQLDALERREFIHRAERTSVAGESEYVFGHVLVRDVAYASIPRAARADGHRRAAAWVEALGRPDDHADLLAHHYLSALELTRATGADPGPLASSAAAALERAGERAFALNSFEQAARYYDEALTLDVASDRRPQLLLRLGTALHFAADPRRTDVLEQAADELFEAGDVERAAEASVLLGEAWWFSGNSASHGAALERAQELVRGRGATPVAALVLSHTARHAMIAARHEEAIRVGKEALAMAEQLGLDERVAGALQSIGSGRAELGDIEGGIADLERAVEVAVAANSPVAASAYSNLAAMVWKFRGAEPAYELYVEGKRVADRFGNAFIGRHIDMAMMWMQFEHGAWDDTLRIADAFLASGTRAYTDYLAHMLRARILHARDDVAGAQAALDRALPVAREAGSPQALVPTLTAAVHIRADLGDEPGARAALEEIIGLYRDGAVADPVLPALYARRLGLESELRDLFNGQPDSPLRVVVLAILDGEFARAADVIADAGDVVHEAAVRLHAAGSLAASGRRAEADEQLAKALAFFTAVDATRYIREGEALLVPAP